MSMSPVSPAPGQHFGRYAVGRRLGHGAMGVVHAAIDTTLGREVALKLVAPHLADDADFRARFHREARLLARLDSARTVRIYDHGEQDGTLFIATQLIDGGDLSGLFAGTPGGPELALDVVDQVLEAIDDAHRAGVVHRDVKPSNILVRRRSDRVETFLCDFGIATSADLKLTRTGGVSGSLPWMAPERHRGEDAGPAGDIYSAGCVLWFALTGATPYVGTEVEIALGHLQGPIPQLPGGDALSTGLNAVLCRAMAKDPTARYATAAAMRADLADLAALGTGGAVLLPDQTSIRQEVVPFPPTAPEDASRRRRRVAVLAPAAAMLLALIGTGAAVWAGSGHHRRAELTADGTGSVVATGSGASGTSGTSPAVASGSPRAHDRAAAGSLLPDDPSALLPSGVPIGVPTGLSPGPGTVPAGVPLLPTAAPHTHAPARTPGTTAPAPAPTTTAPHVYRYRCWSGTRTDTLSSCGYPNGATGESWMFWGTTCSADPNKYNSSNVENWVCIINGSDGKKDYLNLTRWTSASAAQSFYNRWYGSNKTTTTWPASGAAYGPEQYGTFPASDYTRYRFSREYSNIPWAMSVSASSSADRNTLIQRMKGWRAPSQWQGYDCSATPAYC